MCFGSLPSSQQGDLPVPPRRAKLPAPPPPAFLASLTTAPTYSRDHEPSGCASALYRRRNRGTFPSPLVEQSSPRLPPPRFSRASLRPQLIAVTMNRQDVLRLFTVVATGGPSRPPSSSKAPRASPPRVSREPHYGPNL